MSHCIGVLSKGEGGGAYLTFVNISNINIGDNIENNISDNIEDTIVLVTILRPILVIMLVTSVCLVQEKGEVEREGVGSHH